MKTLIFLLALAGADCVFNQLSLFTAGGQIDEGPSCATQRSGIIQSKNCGENLFATIGNQLRSLHTNLRNQKVSECYPYAYVLYLL